MQGRMPDWWRISTGFVILLIINVTMAGSAAVARISDICLEAAQRAAEQTGVPFQVLRAITLVETGRDAGGTITAWPWTLNIEGTGYWLDNRAAALARARQSLTQGSTRFDMGCFQINYHWHGQQFSSLDAMLDPETGALYAARLLQTLYQEHGDWSAAAGAYHSRTARHAARYRARFDRHYAGVATGLPAAPPRINSFPLLRSGSGQTAMGSLVPVFDGGSR